MARKRGETEHGDSRHQAARADEQLESAAGRSGDFWIETHANVVDHMNQVARRWLDRRHDALDATREAIDDMRSCHDVGELFRIQQQWMLGSVKRLTADLSELAAATFELSRRSSTQLGQAAAAAADDTERASRKALRAASPRHLATTE